MALSKQQIRAAYIQEIESLLRCPHCQNSMQLEGENSLKCSSGHSFDLAKQGHVHLLKKAADSNYSKELFTARQHVISSGIYDQLHKALLTELPQEKHRLLDAGCGEGSHMIALKKHCDFLGVGADMAKAGIELAAKQDDQLIWIVADLANTPFQEESFDVILNLFSPANYEEFQRLTKKDGKVIKAVPGKRYLQELRELTGEAAYENHEVIEGFAKTYPGMESRSITYEYPVAKELREDILRMTPLTWKHRDSEEMLEKAADLTSITIDVTLLISHGK